tara:strand:- start:3783 stop:4472 length:690 start_codon:yes stop_codon:yes gene_type:complete
MIELELLDKNDPKLLEVAEPFNFDDPQEDPEDLFDSLVSFMVEHRGIGLAAPQVGLPYRVFVMGNPDEPEMIIPVFNPRITDFSDQKGVYKEGCLSFPNFQAVVKRPMDIRVRYTTWQNVTDAIKFEGISARIFQHEFDHLEGILFPTLVSRFHMERAKKDARNFARKKKALVRRQKAVAEEAIITTGGEFDALNAVNMNRMAHGMPEVEELVYGRADNPGPLRNIRSN